MARSKKSTDFTKNCTKCGAIKTCSDDKTKSEFYRDKSQKSGYATWCKDCERNYNRAYFAALKKTDAIRKSDIAEDSKKVNAFNRVMADERVTRGTKNVKSNSAKRINKPNSRGTRVRNAKKTQ